MKFISDLKQGDRISDIYLCKYKQTATTATTFKSRIGEKRNGYSLAAVVVAVIIAKSGPKRKTHTQRHRKGD